MATDNCKNRSEFTEKALRFYIGYLKANEATEFLCNVLSTTLKGILENNESRMRSLMFKWAVELNMMCHIIAAHYGADEINRRALRALAVDEVKKNVGKISIDHALDVQGQDR